MVKTKVFVGNLAFKTHENDLTREFEAAGKIANVHIITRGARSLGYGFVEMESEEEAQKAVQLLHKKNIDGREINVEVARPREEGPPRERLPRVPRAPRTQGPNDDNNAGGEQRPRARFPYRRPAQPRPEGGAPRDPRRGPPRPRPQGAAPREHIRIAGPHGLFVANLPFTVDDNKLSELFAGLNLKNAHVVRKRNNRSKGFGFVDFGNAEDQAKALQAVDKKNVEGRELIVKIAIPIAQKEQGAGSPAPQKDAAPAASPKAN